MQIAVLISGDGLVSLREGKNSLGGIAGCETLALSAKLGLKVDPLDKMLRNHRMGNGADSDLDGVAIDSDDRYVLFIAGIHGVGNELCHVFHRSILWELPNCESCPPNFHSVCR